MNNNMYNEYKGMTVNERLYVSDYIEEFEEAVKLKDIKKVIFILKMVEITDDSLIEPILKELGLKKKD